MELWALSEFAFILATAAGCLALIIGKLHIIEQAEQQGLLDELKEKVAGIGQ